MFEVVLASWLCFCCSVVNAVVAVFVVVVAVVIFVPVIFVVSSAMLSNMIVGQFPTSRLL